MAEGLLTAEGAPVAAPPVDTEFAALQAAQAAQADEEAPAPPKKDPEAPYGRTKDGKPKRGPGGRPARARAEQPRVASPTAAGVKKDFTRPLTEVVQLAWGVLAGTSPTDAAAVKLAGPGLVSAWNNLAQENAGVARGIEWLTSGSAYGAVVMATAPLLMQIAANHGRLDPERVAALGVQDPAALAEMTAQDVKMMAEAAAAQAA